MFQSSKSLILLKNVSTSKYKGELLYLMQNLKDQIHSIINDYKSGNLVKANNITKKLIKSNPNQPFLYNLMGLILTSQKKINEAVEFYKKGLKIDPKYAMIYNNLGLIYFNLKSTNDIQKAENFYKKAIELNKEIPEPHTNLGNLYNFTGKSNEAIECHKKAIKINPKHPYPYLNLANVYVAVGDFNDAKKNLLEAIKINPNFFYAHRLLSRIIKYKDESGHLKDLKELYKNININDAENKMHISFALGKAFEDIKKFSESFNFYNEANAIFRKKIVFSSYNENQKFQEIKNTYNEDLFSKFKNSGCQNSSPIFILGMPRSGTTLIEQILSNHSDVFGADEIGFIPDIISKNFKHHSLRLIFNDDNIFNINQFKEIGEEYINSINRISNNSKKVTDKLPINFLFIGFIKLILPNAKIIHCYRNPKDNILSIFKNHFPGGQINFAYNLAEITEYYNLYKDLMKHWNKLLPNFIFDIQYENLIFDTKNQIIRLLNFCKLDWQKSCLEFYNNKRTIKTASDTQARSKIYNTSIDSWKNYDKFLNKYFSKLEN